MLGLAACQPTPAPAGSTPDMPGVHGVVTRVTDGDTLTVATGEADLQVRLLGVNAPEAGECLYEEAGDHLRRLVQGREVRLGLLGADQFGRSLAYVSLGPTLVNLELVSNGLAVAATPDQGDPTGSEILEAEDEAYARGVGLWAAEACGATSPRPPISLSVRPDPPGPDDTRLEDEQVTLASTEQENLAGWVLRDESSAHRCTLPAGSTTGPGRPLVVTSADRCWTPGGSPVWNNDGDVVLLLDGDGRVVARHRYPG